MLPPPCLAHPDFGRGTGAPPRPLLQLWPFLTAVSLWFLALPGHCVPSPSPAVEYVPFLDVLPPPSGVAGFPTRLALFLLLRVSAHSRPLPCVVGSPILPFSSLWPPDKFVPFPSLPAHTAASPIRHVPSLPLAAVVLGVRFRGSPAAPVPPVPVSPGSPIRPFLPSRPHTGVVLFLPTVLARAVSPIRPVPPPRPHNGAVRLLPVPVSPLLSSPPERLVENS